MNLIERSRHSIRFRLWLLLAAMSMVMLAVSATLLGTYGWNMQRRQFEDHLVTLAQLMSLNSAAALAFDDVDAAREDVSLALNLQSIIYAAVLRPDKSVFAEAGSSSEHPCPPSPNQRDSVTICEKPSCICVIAPVTLGQETVGYVKVEQDVSLLNHLISGMIMGTVGVFSLTLLLALFMAARIGRSITDPVTGLAAQVREIGEHQRIDTGRFARTQDEISDLARGINDMLDKIARSRTELERSLTLQRTLFDTIPMPVYSKNPDLRFTAMNRLFAAEVSGRQPDEIPGCTLEEVPGNYDHETIALIRKREAEMLATGQDSPFEISVHDAEGKAKIYHVRLGLLRDGSGKVTGVMGVMQDITEIRRIGKELIDVSMREQQRLARDLHDNLGQLLTATAVKLKTIQAMAPDEHATLKGSLASVIDMINRSSREARALSHGLNPVDVERGGLRLALEELAASTEIYARLTCRFLVDGELPELNKDTSNQLYRIAQEAVSNAVRHARASSIDIHLARVQDDVVLTITDDGCGIESSSGESSGGMGLRIMNQRALIIRGELTCQPRLGGGTEVACRCPVNSEDDPT